MGVGVAVLNAVELDTSVLDAIELVTSELDASELDDVIDIDLVELDVT